MISIEVYFFFGDKIFKCVVYNHSIFSIITLNIFLLIQNKKNEYIFIYTEKKSLKINIYYLLGLKNKFVNSNNIYSLSMK